MALDVKSNVKVADDVISVIAGIAATGVDGVVSMGEGITFKAMSFIGTNSLKKGVIIEKSEKTNDLLVKLTVVLKQGVDLKSVCFNIQEKVKEAIESMLDLKVREVMVRVAKIEED